MGGLGPQDTSSALGTCAQRHASPQRASMTGAPITQWTSSAFQIFVRERMTAVREITITWVWSRTQTTRGHWNVASCAVQPQTNQRLSSPHASSAPKSSAVRYMVRSNVIATTHMQSLSHVAGPIPSNLQCRTPCRYTNAVLLASNCCTAAFVHSNSMNVVVYSCFLIPN